MKAVIGVFDEKDDIKAAIANLKDAGFTEHDLALITSYQAEEIRDVLGEQPEKSAVAGALAGTGVGSVLGLLGGAALLPLPGVGPLLASGLMATSGGVLGGYLGSLYATFIEEQPELDLKEALSMHKILLLAKVQESNAVQAQTIMKQVGGNYLLVHEVAPEVMTDLAD